MGGGGAAVPRQLLSPQFYREAAKKLFFSGQSTKAFSIYFVHLTPPPLDNLIREAAKKSYFLVDSPLRGGGGGVSRKRGLKALVDCPLFRGLSYPIDIIPYIMDYIKSFSSYPGLKLSASSNS